MKQTQLTLYEKSVQSARKNKFGVNVDVDAKLDLGSKIQYEYCENM